MSKAVLLPTVNWTLKCLVIKEPPGILEKGLLKHGMLRNGPYS